jgi:hypothetical protein
MWVLAKRGMESDCVDYCPVVCADLVVDQPVAVFISD